MLSKSFITIDSDFVWYSDIHSAFFRPGVIPAQLSLVLAVAAEKLMIQINTGPIGPVDVIP